ncbi:MAG: hypothetical protein LKE54_03760 [Prevotella sp.]|jgi:hypothetical protein|nr:hypothetical protein [Prevotella sp.]MCH3994163.1 hypothetical protein [Prevotella sp.]
MNTAYYKKQKTMLRWDDQHIVGYLNEKTVENYKPESDITDGEQETYTAYSYTGALPDGGTVMPCTDMTDHKEVANAIIRSRYTASEELAIQRHAINGDYKDDSSEYDEYNNFCTYAVDTAKAWVKVYNS